MKLEPVLQAFSNRPCHLVPVQALEDYEQRQIIRAVPSLSAKTLDDVQVDLLLSNPATSNPLFLLVTLEEAARLRLLRATRPPHCGIPASLGT